MSRIDAVVATQIGEISRPPQVGNDIQQQSQQALVTLGNAEGAAVSSEDFRAVASQLRQVIEAASGRRLRFDVDDESKISYVKITDQATGDVIKQIPSQEVLDLHARLDELIGLFINKLA
jgi:flagellar protein FlaG